MRNSMFILSSLFFIVITAVQAAEPLSFSILHTNDLHGHVVVDSKRHAIGLSRVAAYSNKLKKSRPTLLLDAGDCVAGTPLSEFTKGKAIYDIMTKARYDATVLGNHELDNGWKTVAAYREAADFPILCSNGYSPDKQILGDKRYIVRTVGGVKLGIIGVTNKNTLRMTNATDNKGVEFHDEVKVLNELVPILDAKCDLVVVLSHCGIDIDNKIANEVQNIDLIIGGHTHTDLKEVARVNDTYIVQAHDYCQVLGQLDIEYSAESKGIGSLKWTRLGEKDLTETDETVASAIEEWKKKLPAGIYDKIGHSGKTMSSAECKAFIQEAITKKAGADFGYQNRTGVRDTIYAGDIIERDIWLILPFGNQIRVVEILGKNIGGFLKAELDGSGVKPDPDRVYKVATNSYIAQRPGDHLGKPIIKVTTIDLKVRDAVIEQIKSLKKL